MNAVREELYIRISHDDERDVSFVSEDEDRFILSVAETIVASQVHVQRRDEFAEAMERIRALQQHLSSWWKSHANAIKSAYLSYRQGRFLFLVIQAGVPLIEQLEQDLIELEILVARSLEIRPLRMEVMLLPECDNDCINTFVPKEDRRPIPHAFA